MFDFSWYLQPEAWIALATLTMLELVLGIDNIIFINILANRMPKDKRALARNGGLFFAMFTRLLLLFSIAWLAGLTSDLFTVFGQAISWRDIILIVGGLFLILKATQEIHGTMAPEKTETQSEKKQLMNKGLMMVWFQIAMIDIVFSFDSVITAVGLVQELSIMMLAIIISIFAMFIFAKAIGDFIEKQPSVKMLALAFLILVGFVLILDGFDVGVPKAYIYFAMAFSVTVELLNIRYRNRSINQQLKDTIQ